MVKEVRLTERQQQVLQATVQYYIATAEPVGSKALVEEYDFRVSSATIRNVMGGLEKGGLLYQPHTSAGRVPSDSGYRLYVDHLITPAGDLMQQVNQLLSDRLEPKGWSIEAVVRGAAQILATLSGYITLITLPVAKTVTIRHLQLVPVAPGRVMLIAVTDSLETQSVLLELPLPGTTEAETDLTEQELQVLSNFLNHHLRGRSLGELAAADWQTLDREFQKYADCLQTLVMDLVQRTLSPVSNQILITGLAEMLRQPEFTELQQVQTILHLLEAGQDQLWPLIFEWPEVTPLSLAAQHSPNRNRVSIRIGSENPLEPMQTCTLVSTTYQRGETPVGSVGVLGPTRMPYEKVIALVEAAADYLSATVSLSL